MILDLIVHKSDDGFTAEIPSVKGCESWSHTEEDVLENVVEMFCFYHKISDKSKIKLDKARTGAKKIVYKIIFNKE